MAIIALGSLFSILIGYIYKDPSIFTRTNSGFQFIIYGISGSIHMAIIHLSTFRNFILSFISVLMVTILIFKITNIQIITDYHLDLETFKLFVYMLVLNYFVKWFLNFEGNKT